MCFVDVWSCSSVKEMPSRSRAGTPSAPSPDHRQPRLPKLGFAPSGFRTPKFTPPLPPPEGISPQGDAEVLAQLLAADYMPWVWVLTRPPRRCAVRSPAECTSSDIAGVDATVALSIVAAVGDFRRFRRPEQLVSSLGLNPRVKQSGGQPASHGRITKQGRAHARGMLVEAAWVAVKTPGPLRAFYERVRGRRGMQIAVVATARKLAALCWTMIERGEDYAFARPSLTDEAPGARAARRHALPPRPERQGRRVLPRGGQTPRARTRRARREGIPPTRRRLEGQPPHPG
jgi:hypothetical protein